MEIQQKQSQENKWWIISTKGDPNSLFTSEIYKKSIPFAAMYTGFKAYYQVYCYGSKLGMLRLYDSMQENLRGQDCKIIGEEEINQRRVLEDPGLRMKFAPLLNKLNLLT